MANANHKAVAQVTERILTVSAQRRPRPYPLAGPYQRRAPPDLPYAPWIRLSGRWLEQAGFQISSKIRVEIQNGKLIITPV
jgi:toxic protein SymE